MKKIYQRTTIREIEVYDDPATPGGEPIYTVRDQELQEVIQTFDSKIDLEKWLTTWNYIRQI